MSTYAYISCPIPVSSHQIAEVASKLGDMGYSPTWWVRGTNYTDNKLREAQVFVLMSQGNKFDYSLHGMTAGCKKELELAYALGKSLYMAYWKNDKELNIYPLVTRQLDNCRVLGQSGVYIQAVSKVIDNYPIF